MSWVVILNCHRFGDPKLHGSQSTRIPGLLENHPQRTCSPVVSVVCTSSWQGLGFWRWHFYKKLKTYAWQSPGSRDGRRGP